ncbi:hypothetical protein UFOVP109_20 [uncultured Caudovirales phage]|uniref:Uncharacterized protein n=1 Tax=uncultured Caudovirales phage TaxID=2100421 RepID=A0A6J7WQP4_9CAUD|nr:hypothetical protein UFOVP109_20 [uncultured Caudovirales phage]CAB5219138.1 hypothetical protein UFOVP224_33 [uncultured Caudovirales phage]
MTTNALDDTTTTTDDAVEAETPEQKSEHKWQFRPRQSPRWGTVTRAGLIVGRAPNQKCIPPDEVYYLASLACTQKEIARWFGIPEETLKYNFNEYIEKGREETRQRLRQAMLKNALNGNAVMQIFLAKNLLGMRDNPDTADTDKILPWQDH